MKAPKRSSTRNVYFEKNLRTLSWSFVGYKTSGRHVVSTFHINHLTKKDNMALAGNYLIVCSDYQTCSQIEIQGHFSLFFSYQRWNTTAAILLWKRCSQVLYFRFFCFFYGSIVL